jgi:hypothetical protein
MRRLLNGRKGAPPVSSFAYLIFVTARRASAQRGSLIDCPRTLRLTMTQCVIMKGYMSGYRDRPYNA